MRNDSLNAKTMNGTIGAFSFNEFNRVCDWSDVKKIWDVLEITHEGTNQMKESKAI